MTKDGIGTTLTFKTKLPANSKANNKVSKISDRLEEDAQEMEARLVKLRLSMLEEKQKRDRELPLKHGGNRWRSAREDRGSVSNYAKDVTDRKNVNGGIKKKKKKQDQGNSEAASKAKKSLILSIATVSQWTTKEVLDWLVTIGLEEYQSLFEYHQVTGAMLLALTVDDCARIGLTKVSSRNTILAEMDQIREKNRIGGATEVIDPKLRDVPVVPEQRLLDGKAGAVHWSQLKPLAETVIGDTTRQAPVNLADGEFDEDESHASFMKALLEWRASDSERVEDGGSNNAGEEHWVNPMAAIEEEITEKEPEEPSGGGSLLNGTYNEEEAHASFMLALEAWRNGGANTSRPQSSSVNPEQMEQGCTPNQQRSCWQCYRVLNVDSLLLDEQTKKEFCSIACQSSYHQEYARFYPKSENEVT